MNLSLRSRSTAQLKLRCLALAGTLPPMWASSHKPLPANGLIVLSRLRRRRRAKFGNRPDRCPSAARGAKRFPMVQIPTGLYRARSRYSGLAPRSLRGYRLGDVSDETSALHDCFGNVRLRHRLVMTATLNVAGALLNCVDAAANEGQSVSVSRVGASTQQLRVIACDKRDQLGWQILWGARQISSSRYTAGSAVIALPHLPGVALRGDGR